MPKHCREPKHILYKKVCSFPHQLERLFEHVPQEQRLVIISEELASAPEATYRQALTFLGLPGDQPASFPRINASATGVAGR